MKRFQLFSLASAMLLASAAGFTSCSSDSEDPLDGGSGVAGQVVKTQFYLNIPYAGNDEGGNARVSTRMSDVNTQHTTNMATNFLGLVDLDMFAFEETPSSDKTSTRTIRIGDKQGNNDNDSWRRLYSDIAIPVGTTNMVLYTRASKINNSGKTKGNFAAGSLTNPYAKLTDEAKPTLSDLKFNLETIHSANDFATQGSAILKKLNDIAQTKATISGATIEWSKIEAATTIGTPEERKILQDLYDKFVSLTAGSENSVIRAINDLSSAVKPQKLIDFSELTQAIMDNCKTTELNTGFPRNIYLPDGAAVLKFDHETKTFTYKEVNVEVPTGRDLVDHTKITYPSELAYFVSSPVGTSATSNNKLDDLPKYDEWLKKNTDWSQYKYGDVVKSNTTLVVLKEPVQYGVACLESKIQCANTTLEDNAKVILKSTAENNILTVPEEGIKVTGILIGGQPQGVEWNFEPASSATFDHTIYDREMNYGIAAKKSVTAPNYTLVLDNKNSSTADPKQSMVYVTVELENNMGDFYGAEGLIPKGSRFYLVGQLDPNASGVNKPSGTTETLDHVFVKDHTTVANFTIKNLQKAYNHIPDLRTSKINVGLAVDLKWESGITFDVDL